VSPASMMASAARLRDDFRPPDQGQLNSEESAELTRLRRKNRELTREKNFSGWRQRTLPRSRYRQAVSPDRGAV
jgi:hypothetical protein